MHRYIAFAWNHRLTERNSFAKVLVRRVASTMPGWKCGLSTEGLKVYHTGKGTRSSKTYPLDNGSGVVLGKLFPRRAGVDDSIRDVVFDKPATEEVEKSQGRCLLEHYWGRYVAFLKGRDDTCIRILRDPTGAMPCLLTKFRGVIIICSHIDDCVELGVIDSGINWDHIAAYLWFDRLVTSETGLDNVRQIQAGECVAVKNDNDRIDGTFYWRPDRIHDSRLVDDRQEAMSELRSVIQRCVGSWASCYSDILHGLSGGLDSAVVLACLSRSVTDTNVICLNYYTQGAEGDERAFARAAANTTRFEFIEVALRSSDRKLENMFDSKMQASPTLTFLVPESELEREKLVKERGIQAVFSGQGGDHFFQQTRTRLIAADYAWRHGLRQGLLSVIADTSRLTRTSVWSVMASTISSGFLRKHRDPYDQYGPSPLVSNATLDGLNLSSIRHPWVDGADDLPCGKRAQIADIIDTQNFYHHPSHYAEIVHPLISQPIIELCLQIPSYVLTYGGIDRALVRDAFTGIVPHEIVGRTAKGTTTGYFNGLLLGNLLFLREYLLDGILVREGLLDRGKTEASLTDSSIMRNSLLLFPILDAIRAEAWLRTWVSKSQRAAA